MSEVHSHSDFPRLTQDLARELGCSRVIALGAPRPERLVAAAAGLELIVLDGAERVAAVREYEPEAQADDWNPAEAGPLPLSGDVLRDAIVVSDGVIEALNDPGPLIARLAEALAEAPGAIVVTGDRDLVGRGAPAAVRLTADELRERLEGAGIDVSWLGIASSPWDRLERSSSVAVLGGRGGERLGGLFETGARNLRFDPGADLPDDADGPLRICIATYEFVGPTKTGGIGTAYTSLAEALAEAGHEVKVLYLGLRTPEDEKLPFSHWVDHYGAKGIELIELPESDLPRVFYGHFEAKRSYLAYMWLAEADREKPFDVIHFPETLGHGYYTQLAKQQGWAFDTATIAIGIHSSTFWVVETNRTTFLTGQEFAADFLERTSVELADTVISPSAYMVDWMQSKGWRLPDRVFLQQYVRSRVVAESAPEQHGGIDEIVFFGRLETRKGIRLFADALDELAEERELPEVSIAFMGKEAGIEHEMAGDYLKRRAKEGNWPWEWKVIDDYGQPEAVAYLRGNGVRRLAVMPSLVDNTPNTVMEALALRIPFITSRVGGTAELIHPLDLGRATFDPRGRGGASDLATALREAVAASDFRPPRPAVDSEPNEKVHLDWHAGVARASREARREQEPEIANVTVSSPVMTGEGANGRVTVESLETQDHLALEVVPVSGDAGGRPDALNRAARDATGTYLLFFAEGAVAEPTCVSSLVRVAERTGADVVTSAAWWSVGGGGGEGIRPPEGGPPVAGLFYRCFGDGGYLIRREAFEALGGFDPDVEPNEDHHLLCRVALDGRRIETVPEPLLRQRISEENAGDAIHARGEATLRAYQQQPLNGLSELAQIAQAQWILSGSKDAQIKGILESRSWRITTPLRWVTGKLGRTSDSA